jgi:predicted permease
MVLLIGCANLMNIMLARAAARRREIAVRLALGASRGQLISQLLTESFMLSFMGCVLGIYMAVTCSRALLTALISHLPPDTPRLTLNLTPDIRVYSYCVGLMLLTTVLIGLVPALQSTRTDVATALKIEHLQSARTGKSTLRNVLVGAQVTISALLLICAGLLLHGVMRGERVNPGFDAAHTADVSLDLTRQGYDAAAAASVRAELIARLRELPSVTAIAEAQNAPLAGRHELAEVEVGGGNKQILETNRVSAAYFSTLRIPLVRGRSFTDAEVRSGAAVAIVPNPTAQRVWPGQDPIGKVLRWNGKSYDVIGVTADTRSAYLPRVDAAYVYVPLAPGEPNAEVIVRFAGGYAVTANTIRQLVRSMDANLVCGVTRIADNGVTWIAPARISAALATVLGALALVLAAIGIYGTIAYTVSRRVREISIRMVFGARAIDVHKLVLGQALRPVLAGAAIGSVLAVAAAQLLRSLLFGVSTFDAASYATVVTFLVATAVFAAYLPARHAAQIEPMRALHEE